jgi:hypothetical protein
MALPTSMPEEPLTAEPAVPSLTFPLGWMLKHAAPSLAYRSMTEVAGMTVPDAAHMLPYHSRLALSLAMTQALDGTWNGTMLTTPADGTTMDGAGTIPAFRRLLEYGWDHESPPVLQGRRTLFRLLAEDNDPRYLYELRKDVKNAEMAVRARNTLREAAAAVLAQAGYEADPRLRGAARRIMERVDAFFLSDLADKPWVRIGNRHVLAAEVQPPSIFTLMMLAHMPIFRSEHYPEMERLYFYLSQPKPTQDVVQMVGGEIIAQPHLVMGDWLYNKNVVDADVPFALLWFETMARLNFLKRNDNWSKLFDRLVDDRDRSCVWHPHKGTDTPTTTSAYAWPIFPLEERMDGESRWTDVTFRIGLIAQLNGWRIDVV